jgi:transcriptional regulator with PAS, ATPase and Fis domain
VGPNEAHARSPARTAVLVDSDSHRRAGLVEALAHAGWELVRAGRAPIACIAVDHAGAGDAQIAEWIAQGTRVLAFAPGCDHWRIGERCHVVVAGATALLDSTQAEFTHRVAERLEAWHAEAERARSDGSAAQRRMRRLGLVGHSTALNRAFTQVERVARLSDLPVLLHGETGSGKELLAHAIHGLDARRRAGPFVAVNCAAIAPALAETELFGHERGAYTGAHREKRGLVRAAHGGVLFLDEVGELADELQGKLLRMLQERRVLPVGAEHEQEVDVRVVAATHRDLAARVREGRFREDLYFRLAVLPIEVPPLRERRDDIGELVDHLLARSGRQASDAYREALASCELPGNVRELENLVHQSLVAAGEDDTLDLAHLPAGVLRQIEHRPPSRPDATEASAAPGRAAAAEAAAAATAPALDIDAALAQLCAAHGWNLARCVDTFERSLLQGALDRAQGNQAAAARLMGVTPRCVYTKLRKHLLA